MSLKQLGCEYASMYAVFILSNTRNMHDNSPQQVPCCLQDLLPADVPIISVSKGLEVGTGKMMSELIVDVFGRKHPAVFISGPSFAKEVMTLQPTGVVAASKVSGPCMFSNHLH